MKQSVPSPQSSRTLLARIYRDYLRAYMATVVGAMLLMTVAAALTGAQAFLMEPIINEIFVNRDGNALYPLGAAIFATFALRGVTTWGHIALMARVGHGILAKIQTQVIGHLTTLDLGFFQRRRTGDLISRLTNDVAQMRMAVAEGLTGMAKAFLTLVGLVAVMFYQDWFLSLMAFVVFPPAILMVDKIGKKIRSLSGQTQDSVAQMTHFLAEIFDGIRVVKAYGMEAYERSRADKIINRLFRLNTKVVRVAALSTPLSELLTAGAIIAIILYGGHQVVEGTKTPGELFSFLTAFGMAYEPLKKMAKLNTAVQTGLASSQRVFDLLEETPAPHEVSGKASDTALLADKNNAAEIAFDRVHFHYGDTHNPLEPVLSSIDVTIPAGKKVALVGPSGGGKSTLLNLIPRLYAPTDGRVLINGQDIAKMDIATLRAHMALVSQDVTVFQDTVRSNIAYGDMTADDQAIESAAKLAGAHAFITQLSDGYDTMLGAEGTQLSGGQRQRLALARAMIRRAPILLLDEATSALDTETERVVTEALANWDVPCTQVVVAHRLSTVRDADLILVMDSGRIVAQGTHDSLLAEDGVYQMLHATMVKTTS